MYLTSTKGLDITAQGTIPNSDDINITCNQSVNIIAHESNDKAITLKATQGGIDIDCTGTSGEDIDITAGGSSINIIATEDASDAIVIRASQGGVGLIANGTTADDDIDLLSSTSINLIAYENSTDSINITSVAGGIDITANGTAGEDIDIEATGSSVNITSTENVPDAIVINSSLGGIDILSNGEAGQDIDIKNTGGSVNIESTEAIADAITLNATAGGVDITANNDIDVSTTNYMNFTSSLNQAQAIKIKTTTSGGGILIQAQGEAGRDIDIINNGGSINLKSTENNPDAIQIESSMGGIKLISTGQNTGDDIYVKASKSFSLIADETASDAINISATAGGINILSSAQPENDINIKSTGASINIESTEDVTDAIMIKASNGGVAILSQGTTEGDDIDLISTTSINLFASEDKADSININSVNGGIDITANGDPGQDIDITNTGGSIHLQATENATNAITIKATAGGIDIDAVGTAGEDIDITNSGGSINLTSGESASDAIVLQANNGGIDIKALGTSTGNDIDIESSEKINLISGDADTKSIKVWANTGGIDIGCTGVSKDIKIEAYNGNVRVLRPIIDYPQFNTYEDTDYSVWVPFTQFNVVNGVWDIYRDPTNGDFCWRKEGKEEMFYLTADLTLPTRDNAIKGYKMTAIYLAYAIETQDIKSIDVKTISKTWNPTTPLIAPTTTVKSIANSALSDVNLQIVPIVRENLINHTENGGIDYQVNVQLEDPGNFWYASADSYFVTSKPWKAFDTINSTHWVANTTAFPHWLTYDMQTPQTVMRYKWRVSENPANMTPYSWVVKISSDGTNYTDVDTRTEASTFDSSKVWWEYNITTPTEGRYIRFHFTGSYGTGNQVAISECNFYRTSTVYVETNGNEVGNEAYKAFDGDSTNYVNSAKLSAANYGNQWFSYDFKANKQISSYRLTHLNTNSTDPIAWQIQTSSDNTTWTTVDTRTGQDVRATSGFPNNGDYYMIPLANQTNVRYIRMVVTANRTSSGITEIAELEYCSGVERYVGKSVGNSYRSVNIVSPQFVNAHTSTSLAIDVDCNTNSVFKLYGASIRYNRRHL